MLSLMAAHGSVDYVRQFAHALAGAALHEFDSIYGNFRRPETRHSSMAWRAGSSRAEQPTSGDPPDALGGALVRCRILIYGATGYTGRLIAGHARNLRHSPIVAGRNADRAQALAAELALPARVIALDARER